MTKKIFWCYDLAGLTGCALMLFGLYQAWGLATLLIASGLMLMGWALWMSYLDSENDDDDPGPPV